LEHHGLKVLWWLCFHLPRAIIVQIPVHHTGCLCINLASAQDTKAATG
jgi:hypothetical protein